MKHLTIASVVIALAALALSLRGQAASPRERLQTVAGRTIFQWKRLAIQRRVERDRARARLGGETRLARRLSRELARQGEAVPVAAIRLVFGEYAPQAIRVSACETGGTFSVSARNGQYLGLFQMGRYARGRYGHGSSALVQAQAAYRYFVDSGRDWSPWECKP